MSRHFLKSNIVKTARLKDKFTVAQEEAIPNIWNATVWWPWLTSKRVARVCQHQLSFLLYCLAAHELKNTVQWLTFRVIVALLSCIEGLFGFSPSHWYGAHWSVSVDRQVSSTCYVVRARYWQVSVTRSSTRPGSLDAGLPGREESMWSFRSGCS